MHKKKKNFAILTPEILVEIKESLEQEKPIAYDERQVISQLIRMVERADDLSPITKRGRKSKDDFSKEFSVAELVAKMVAEGIDVKDAISQAAGRFLTSERSAKRYWEANKVAGIAICIARHEELGTPLKRVELDRLIESLRKKRPDLAAIMSGSKVIPKQGPEST